ncbi:hypothetical protein ACFQL0_18690 [Haloplanus litoreus]|uniref:hypothetical protein n=1 Tax=Haloplanus litoreus TaxID=767515 RepID=UPI0036183060
MSDRDGPTVDEDVAPSRRRPSTSWPTSTDAKNRSTWSNGSTPRRYPGRSPPGSTDDATPSGSCSGTTAAGRFRTLSDGAPRNASSTTTTRRWSTPSPARRRQRIGRVNFER